MSQSFQVVINIKRIILYFYYFVNTLANLSTTSNPTEPSSEFTCITTGKFPDHGNPHRYHQCFLLFGKLTYIHNTCPTQTCFNTELNYCEAEACKTIITPVAPTSYSCQGKSFRCKKQGIFGAYDGSIYFKCSKVWGRWTAICYTCNSKHKFCYSEKHHACIPNNGKPCAETEKEESGETSNGNVTTVSYDCAGYSYFPCTQLHIGHHQLPGDLSVYVECRKNKHGKMEGICHQCPKKGNTCFVEGIDQCVERCGKGSPHKPYNCSTYTIDDVSCVAEGYIAASDDTSVFFNCVKSGTKWDIHCYTCSNGKTKTCFSEVQQACVTYDGPLDKNENNKDKCPPISVIDGPGSSTEVGTADSSLTWDCEGYSNEESFPCNKIAEEGEFNTAADRSISFKCSKRGDSWIAECQACPSETWSCYDAKEETCVRDCVPRVHSPFDCRTYDELSYPCTETGYFANTNDTSIYHLCLIQEDGTFKSWCYTCSNGFNKTCFSNEAQACVTNGNDDRPCGTIETLEGNPDKGTKESSLTYSIDGYSETSFPCQEAGNGEFDKPGDASVFVICKGTHEAEFQVCPQDTKSCYHKEEKRCIENCGLGEITTTVRPVPSYSCKDIQFECTEKGIFAYELDTSLYIECTESSGPEETLVGLCYTCSSTDQTCFSEEKQACVKTEGETCGDKNSLGTEGEIHMSYSCEGYHSENSFPCRELGHGFFGVPGDKSLFVECYTAPDGHIVAKCHSCLKSGNGCYDPEKKVCVKNCGKGELHKPYECSTYNDNAYPCTKPGYFANSFHTSVYFECVKINGTWKSYCYSCSSLKKTCFNDQKQACVLNEGKECGNTTMPVKGGTKIESLSFSCDGYTNSSFPISKVKPGTYVMPGDHSVYWIIYEDQEQGECLACEEEKTECYDPVVEKCVENCGKGPPPKPYNCSTYNRNSFNCKKEGLFANFYDESVFFRCVKNSESETGWDLECFTCNSRDRTCFDEVAQACVDNGGKPCTKRLIDEEITSKVQKQLVPRNASRTHTCIGYEGFQFPCRKIGNFTSPGDKSIYYMCMDVGERILPHCKACPKAQKSCFIEEKNKCVDNCGKGAFVSGTVRPYDCSGYHLGSFPCQQEGLFVHPQDQTVFFHCIKNRNNQWESHCYTCNFKSKSCFSNKRQRCIIGCIDDSHPIHDKKEISLTYGDNCRGYGISAIPCGPLNGKRSLTGVKTYFQHLGDPAVYFHCVQTGLFFQAFCHLCPLSSCFDQTTQTCVAPCSDYAPVNPSNPVHVGPPWSHDCRFYNNYDAYPCTEEGLFANPVDTSILFSCVKTKEGFDSVCYTCHSKLKSCFNEAKKACFVTEDSECGTIYTTKATGNGKSYDCSGYEPQASLPCSYTGVGTWPIPGDTSCHFSCTRLDNTSTELVGECHTCSREKAGCFDPSKKKCVDHCILLPYKPYSCAIYNYYSFHCSQEGFFAQIFDSSVFFLCIREGKYWKALCFTCNSHLKTCFSNKKQTCLTKGGGPCGEGDPYDTVVGGTKVQSRHHTCLGYNDLSFPCTYFRAGKYGTPADESIYFSCIKHGDKWLAECGICSKVEESCFDNQQKVCIENCGRGPDIPYQCHSYDFQAIPCTQPGYFSNKKDSSVFFKCVKTTDIFAWKTYCFSCNEVLGTCFDEVTGACLTNDGVPCKAITGPAGKNGETGKNVPKKGDVEESRSYDCTGYNELSFPCALYGTGKYHQMPADQGTYFECVVSGGQLIAVCHHCDSKNRECFIDKEQKCVANCGLGPHQPWNCRTRRFKCVTEGLFTEEDNSIFYKCQRRADGTLESQCYSCSSGPVKTCFSQKKGVCLKITGDSCNNIDPIDKDNTMTEEISRTYSCLGYNQWSFPCDKYGQGVFSSLAEKSVYFECNAGAKEAECKVCDPESDSVFDPITRECVPNFGKGPHKPYSCYTYHDQSFKCKKPGYFANKVDTSVFFKCVKRGDRFDSYCYTCSSTKKTCFSNSQQACVTNGDKECQGGDPFIDNTKAGTKDTSLTFDCGGYNHLSFPCSKHSPGIYGHPGDLSVYFSCEKTDKFYLAECHTCNQADYACFDNAKNAKTCVPNCLKGETRPYDCSTTHWMSYPCTMEGGFWQHPSDSSMFFSCVKKRNVLEAICYTCNEKFNTCWSNTLKACVTIGEGERCGPEDPESIEDHGDEKSSRTYDIIGYKSYPPHFPCAQFGEGQFFHPGDKSVYVVCSKKKVKGEIVWKEEFKVCQDKPQGGFYDPENRKCDMENRWVPTPAPPPRPYKPKKAKKYKIAKVPPRG